MGTYLNIMDFFPYCLQVKKTDPVWQNSLTKAITVLQMIKHIKNG